jgi:hypothetical protein
LVLALTRAMGGTLTDAQRILVQRAAGLNVVAEEARARAMRGEPVDLDELVKLGNLADRAVRALGIQARTPEVPE